MLPFYISGEHELIRKCIKNIFENALRFSPKSGTIEIRTLKENQHIICEIKDEGKGFAEGAVNYVFDLFTTDEEYKDNSIGFGLPIAKMIMESHNGNILIGNNAEGGANVKLIFKSETEN